MLEVDYATAAELAAATTDIPASALASTLDLSGKTITLPAANTPAFTKSYASAEQAISNAGAGTLAHGLGGMPALIQARLICKTAEQNYSIGDEILLGTQDQTSDRGVSIKADATNITYRYVNSATPFSYPNATTGAIAALTNANWRLVIRAWA